MEECTATRVSRRSLEGFCCQVFEELGLPSEDAWIAAEVLVAADARGIPSHGVARLGRYVHGLKVGLMKPAAVPEVLRETAATLVLDAHGAMGAPVSVRTMRAVMAKARSVGTAFGCVRDSNHFGIAGFYAMMPLSEDMIGVAMTNTAALGVPTFGRMPMLGTNPLAFAAPADEEGAFVLDMSTMVVTRGRVEVYDRQAQALPEGWAVDEKGHSATDAEHVLHNLTYQVGGGILPLGGLGEMFGGHKGYGLAVMVDVLCAILSGGAFASEIADTPGSSARVSHFFGAMRVDAFRDTLAFRRDMDELLRTLRKAEPAEGQNQVYVAGQKEREHEATCMRDGVPVPTGVLEEILDIGRTYGVSL